MVFILLLLSLSAQASDRACQSEIIKASKTISPMPPTNYQENSALCFAFSSMQLLNHFRCKTENRCNFGYTYQGGADELSIRDGLSIYHEKSVAEDFGTGGLPEKFLSRISAKGNLALESCAPLMQLSQLSLNSPGVDMYDLLRKLYSSYKKSNKTAACFISDEFPNLENQGTLLQEFLVDVQAALARQSEEEFLRQVTLPQRCEAQRNDLPKFSIETFTSTQPKKIKDKINSLIDQGIPFSFTHNIYRREQPSDPKVFFGAHAANIAGKRVQCCSGKCDLQYLVLDSSGVEPNERWEPASTVIRSILDLTEVDAFGTPEAAKKLSAKNYPGVLKPVVKIFHEVKQRDPTPAELKYFVDHLKGSNRAALVWLTPGK
jgi:hypothetical protein